MPKGCIPLLIGDLNVDLTNPRDDRDEVVAKAMDALDVSCLTRYFGHRRGRLIKGRWIWQQRRRNRYITSKPSYFLAGAKGRARVTACNIKCHSIIRQTTAPWWLGFRGDRKKI